ncbi:CsbD family protein [soil metagenome]
MKIGTIDLDQLRGLGDKLVGLGKELTGTVLGQDKLQEAGQAQQKKGERSLEALKKDAQAQKARAEASTGETKQRAAEKAKA